MAIEQRFRWTELCNRTFVTTWILGKAVAPAEEDHSDVQIPSQGLGNASLEFVGLTLCEIDVTRCPSEPIRNSAAMDVYWKDGSV